MPLGSIIGGLIGAGGASAAGAGAEAAGLNTFKNAQTEMAKNREAISPWTSVGRGAVNQLAQLYGLGHLAPGGGQSDVLDTSNVAGDRTNALADFQASPGYQWRLDQGLKAIGNSGSARGMSLSGAQLKALNDYAGGSASQEFGNYTNALSGLSGGGESGVQSMTNANASIFNPGNNANFQGQMGRASSYSNAANALASGIGNGINNAFSLASYGLGGGFGGVGGGASAPGVGQFPGATPLSSY